mgnify:CR=1 FL=1|jgi:hypothetical protein
MDSSNDDEQIRRFLKEYSKKEFRCIILFPSKDLDGKLYDEIVNKQIIYTLEIASPLDFDESNNNFPANFIHLVYYDEEWCKASGNVVKKSKSCFNGEGNLKIFFIEKTGTKYEMNLSNLKRKIRKFYREHNRKYHGEWGIGGGGDHSVHTPDTQEECNRLLQLLNKNTISFMQKTPSLDVNLERFNIYFDELIQFCQHNNIDTDDICITSSAVLSVYGIRDCGDIDLFVNNNNINIFKNSNFDIHNQYSIDGHYPYHFEDIIYNPNHHFYYKNIKFCILSIIFKYKNYRVKHNLFSKMSVEKDIKDINYIQNSHFI